MTGDAARALFLSQAIPFVGFGFMDNAIMIIAGEYIEMSIGAALALSTMAAAGLGNLLSDIAGIGFSSKIESLTETFLKIRPPELSRAAASSFNARFVKMLGAVVGVSVGCLLGMFPLLFFDADHDHNLRPDEDGDATVFSPGTIVYNGFLCGLHTRASGQKPQEHSIWNTTKAFGRGADAISAEDQWDGFPTIVFSAEMEICSGFNLLPVKHSG